MTLAGGYQIIDWGHRLVFIIVYTIVTQQNERLIAGFLWKLYEPIHQKMQRLGNLFRIAENQMFLSCTLQRLYRLLVKINPQRSFQTETDTMRFYFTDPDNRAIFIFICLPLNTYE